MTQIHNIARTSTRNRQVLDYFYEAEEATLAQAKKDLASVLVKGSKGSTAIGNLLHDGRLVQEGEIIRLSRAMKVMFDELHNKKVEVVSQPYRNVFGPAISPKNIPSAQGIRQGSNDHLSWNRRNV